MRGPSTRNDQQRVDAHVVAFTHVARREAFRGDNHPPQAPLVECEAGRFLARSRFHLNESEDSPASGDDIHFAAADARAPRENAPAPKPQIPAGEGLRATATLLGGLAIHFARSSARA